MPDQTKHISEINSDRLDKVEGDTAALGKKVGDIEATLLSHAHGCEIQWKQYGKDMTDLKGFLQRQEARHNKLLWIFVSGFITLITGAVGTLMAMGGS